MIFVDYLLPNNMIRLGAQTYDFVIPAKAGIHRRHLETNVVWIPAFAGMTP